VTVFQFLEHLSDRQAADAVRSRIDWKYALSLELDDPGFHFSVLTEFRARLIASHAEYLLLDRMLEHFKARSLIKPRGRQRTDSTHVLGAVRNLHLLELVTQTLRYAERPGSGRAQMAKKRGRSGLVQALCTVCRRLAPARRQ
jgi:transposase